MALAEYVTELTNLKANSFQFLVSSLSRKPVSFYIQLFDKLIARQETRLEAIKQQATAPLAADEEKRIADLLSIAELTMLRGLFKEVDTIVTLQDMRALKARVSKNEAFLALYGRDNDILVDAGMTWFVTVLEMYSFVLLDEDIPNNDDDAEKNV